MKCRQIAGMPLKQKQIRVRSSSSIHSTIHSSSNQQQWLILAEK